MKLLGFEIKRVSKTLSPPSSGRWFTIHDQYPGAWQQDTAIELDSVLTFSAVFACVRLISTDIGKLGVKLMELQESGIRTETVNSSHSPVLRKQNHYQTRIKFFEQWIVSKLLHGNTYILKARDKRGVVTNLYVLDPTRVQPLVSDSGEVFYRLNQDHIAGVHDPQITFPATEIIHDVHVTPHHPLIGMSPIAAAGLAAMQGLKIQNNSEKFFANMSRPGGLLIAPGRISQEQAEDLRTQFNTNYGGENVGKIAVISDGMTFKETTMSATDAQLIEQLKFTGELVCTAFGVPAYKVGIGAMPSHNNMAALNQLYYDDCLQELIECVEILLLEGLELPSRYSVHFDLDDLLRMDATSRNAAYETAIKAGWKSPNEVRLKENYEPVEGGEEPIMQQQNWPLSVLAQRAPPDTAPPPAAEPEPEPEVQELSFRADLIKELSDVRYA
jgi:HK97 family phage portal protein